MTEQLSAKPSGFHRWWSSLFTLHLHFEVCTSELLPLTELIPNEEKLVLQGFEPFSIFAMFLLESHEGIAFEPNDSPAPISMALTGSTKELSDDPVQCEETDVSSRLPSERLVDFHQGEIDFNHFHTFCCMSCQMENSRENELNKNYFFK